MSELMNVTTTTNVAAVEDEETGNVSREAATFKNTVSYPSPTSLDEAIEVFGEETVLGRFLAQIRVDLQGKVRSVVKSLFDDSKEVSDGAVQAQIFNPETDEVLWKPGTRRPAKSELEKVTDLLNSLSPELRKQLLEQASA